MEIWNLERIRIRSRNIFTLSRSILSHIIWLIYDDVVFVNKLKGLFTLLVEEFGCQGVEVEEVYDLDSFDLHSGEVYGLIFLFKWANDQVTNNRTSR